MLHTIHIHWLLNCAWCKNDSCLAMELSRLASSYIDLITWNNKDNSPIVAALFIILTLLEIAKSILTPLLKLTSWWVHIVFIFESKFIFNLVVSFEHILVWSKDLSDVQFQTSKDLIVGDFFNFLRQGSSSTRWENVQSVVCFIVNLDSLLGDAFQVGAGGITVSLWTHSLRSHSFLMKIGLFWSERLWRKILFGYDCSNGALSILLFKIFWHGVIYFLCDVAKLPVVFIILRVIFGWKLAIRRK
jgi:hypothetical protein